MRTRLKSPDLYTIGWIAALPIERAAATALLHDRHDAPESFDQHRSDTNSYTWGRIGEHNVVIASLPAGVYGTTSAATTASNLIHSLPHIRIGLLVGIGGGIARPDEGQDVRLGDIVVSQPDGTTGGVVQYDFGKVKANGGWERKGSLDKPPSVLLHALASLQAEHEIGPSKVPDLLQAMLEANPGMTRPKRDFTYQGAETDRLFEPQHNHVGGSNCDKCDSAWEVERDQRESSDPEIHYGIIASGNKLIKDAATRDSLSGDTGHQCLCVEMEAAGLMDRFPCLVIRGICDYADSHKNDRWQRYAAATAAAFAVELLEYVPVAQLEATQKIAEVIQSLDRRISSLSTPIHNLDYRTAFVQLPIAEGASFDSKAEEHNSQCLPNTREELLEKLDRWIDDPKSEIIFWLNGMAGTGKSTISRTIARARSERADLGASFFFKRGEIDRGNLSKFMPTLAYQLALSIPGVAFFIKKTLDANPAIVGKSLKEQFERLIQEPLSEAAATATTPSSVVMVIDALDECDQEADIRLLINIFSQANTVCPQLRVFLTSRPELPIRLGFSEVQGSYQDLVLHDIPAQIVEHDIFIFLDDEFRKIRHSFNMTVCDKRKLLSDWPGRPIIQRLAQIAVPLFIFAATVCRFIGDRKYDSPPIQLRKVLDYKSKGHVSRLDLIYGPVLRSLITDVSGDDKKQIINDFKMIIGSIVMLAEPLSAWALSQLLEVDPEVVDNRLDTLHSVLSIPPTRKAPVRLLHLSFQDYLIKEESEFQVNERYTHQSLAKHCLRIMRGALRKNICGLSFPGMRRSAVDPGRLEKSMPSQVQYACMHWAYHQTEGDSKLNDNKEVYDFLMTHFLHWVEAMSLLGRVKECLDSLRSLARWSESLKDLRVSTFVADAVRIVQVYFSIIAEAPLQIYCCLAFTPSKSIMRRTLQDAIPRWVSNLPKVEESWDACLLTLEGHSDNVRSVVFSHDSKWVASGSPDKTIRIWDAETGKCERVLEGHSDNVSSVVFSYDSKWVASGSPDKTIRIWDAETGKCERVLEGHSDYINSVVFSHDSKWVASASGDKTIRIWDAETGECERVLEGHSDNVRSVVFSHDSKWVASGSNDKTIRIWDAGTGECEDVVSLHGYANVISFTLDGRGIVTDRGIFPLTCDYSQSRPDSAMPWQSSHAPMLACTDSTWVTVAGNDLLWLPPECRNGNIAVSGSRVAIGCQSGRVLVLGISIANMEPWMDITNY
ncbi:Vegetative incompatibility protein HET-E-1 [Fusarium oxysporum f. sp. rapae]|uniref:Vegetative incompatibility protein HET-E-1 n=1 Tax=Fusarium oxysporum f. sp. rapae TaxID=485398 RepID=A0A8J5P822_FUSOX|nr:Vegetative incompatibility protein HET-E-1 [Fusarium oxysporum f. sp. rapae]